VKTRSVAWLLLVGLLLQTLAWALPAGHAGQAQRLAHQVAHALDHGHHRHAEPHADHGHDIDTALLLEPEADIGPHGPHHSHVSEGVQLQGLPEAYALAGLTLARVAPRAGSPLHPPSADPDGLLRPPQSVV
jgi:hypothetical protein